MNARTFLFYLTNLFRIGRIFFFLLVVLPASGGELNSSIRPKDGFVPSKDVAITIAKAVLVPIYGIERIQQQEPFVARLSGNVWIVEGSLLEGHKGGTAIIKIAKTDGQVLFVKHGK